MLLRFTRLFGCHGKNNTNLVRHALTTPRKSSYNLFITYEKKATLLYETRSERKMAIQVVKGRELF